VVRRELLASGVLEWGLVILFIALFITQSIIFTILLLRLKRKLYSIKTPRAWEPFLTLEKPSQTVLKVLRELSSSNGLEARELSKRLGLSREYTARLLKKMVEDGLVVRRGKPYKYQLTELGIRLLKESED